MNIPEPSKKETILAARRIVDEAYQNADVDDRRWLYEASNALHNVLHIVSEDKSDKPVDDDKLGGQSLRKVTCN